MCNFARLGTILLLTGLLLACGGTRSDRNTGQNVIISLAAAAASGIPDPNWGTTHPVNTQAAAQPAEWPGTPVPGYYYVDNAHISATDSSNPYGTPNTPRNTIPNPIPAGSVVEIHGVYNTNVTINAQGTESNPVFVRGVENKVNQPVFGLVVHLEGSYLIVENIKVLTMDGSVPNGGARVTIREGNHHIALRNSEMSGEGNLNRTGGIAVGSWSYSGSNTVEYIVLNNLFIHDVGDVNSSSDQDGHGINVNGSVRYLWLLNSEITRTSGDGMQIEAQHSRGRENIHHIYAGNNTIYNNKQTGLWIKHAHDVIFSGNIIYNMADSDSSGGECMGYQNSGDYFWFINNDLSGCYVGIAAQSGDAGEQTNVYYIGNIIHNMNSNDPGNPHNAGGIKIRMGYANHYIVNNTIHDTDYGISAPINSGRLYIYNNILSERNEPNSFDIYVESAGTNSEVDNNTIYNPAGVRIYWNGRSYSSLVAFNNSENLCSNCNTDNPQFTDITRNDFSLQASSTAINSGSNITTVYSDFLNRYGFPIDMDIIGNTRISDSSYDIGAIESNSQ